MKPKSRLSAVLVLLLTGVGLLLHYHRVVFSPNTVVTGATMDGLKNYYTPWYHVAHDDAYFWFEGMNYPYGEQPVFADAQPLLSNIIRFVSRNLVDVSDYTVGILNLALFFGLMWAAWLLFLILKRFRVEPVLAAVAASALTLLSPQMLKITGHYALGYAFVVPLVWYLALRFYAAPHWKPSLLLAGAVFIFAWLHPYYLMISAVFLTALALVHWFFQPRDLRFWSRLLHLGLQVLLPGILFGVILKLSDPVTDRPGNPYGFEEYIATWRTVFLPYAIPGLDWVKRFQTDLEENWEGVAYVGMAGGTMFLFFLFRVGRRVVRRFRKRRVPRHRGAWISTQPQVAISVGAGLLVLLFACGFPFSYKPELMTDLFPPIKQFRSLGRFAWVFYYTWTVFAVYLIQLAVHYHRQRGRPGLAYAVLGLALGATFAEGWGYNSALSGRISRVQRPKMVHDGQDNPWIPLIDPNQYEAIVALPFFHEGSENYTTDNAVSYAVAFEASIKTGLPLLNVMMSRTSLGQTWSHFQLTTEPYRPLELLDKMTGDKPLLAIRMGSRLRFDDAYLQPRPPFLYDDGVNQVYAIDLPARQAQFLAERPTVPDSLTPLDGTYLGPAGQFFYSDELEGDAEGYRKGKGTAILLKDNNELVKQKFPRLQAGDSLVLSLWVKLKGDRLGHAMFGWEEHGPDGENVTWTYPALNKFVVAMDGEWALLERDVVVKDPRNEFMVNVTRWKRKPPELVIDRFHIRKKGERVYSQEDGKIVAVNNRYF
ncbi:MAG: hypothetical protein AAF998_00535 [Bacteroidota bacterium]